CDGRTWQLQPGRARAHVQRAQAVRVGSRLRLVTLPPRSASSRSWAVRDAGVFMGVFRTRARSLAVLLSSAVIVLTAACAGEGPAGPGDMGGAAKDREAVTSMPAIYVDSRLEFLIDDRNLVRDNYLLNRDVCRESGLPLRELSDE